MLLRQKYLFFPLLKAKRLQRDITRSIKHARKSVSRFLGEASFSREFPLWKMITLSEAFVISTQFRETLDTIRQTWYFKSFENLQSTLNEVLGIVFFDVKGRTMDENNEEMGG